MELQLALDRIEKKRAIDIVESLKDLIDIVEIGTPFSIMQPIEIINDFKKISPCLRVLADYKIMDGGYALAEIAYKAGADIVTVSAQTWDETILQTIQAARDYGKQVLVDMMGIKEEDIAERGFAAHWKYKHATISQDEDEFDKWLKQIRAALNSPTENAVDFLDNFKLS